LSTDAFAGDETSRILGPLLRWALPNASEATIALVHAVVRKLAHFTEYAVLGILVVRALVDEETRFVRVALRALLLCIAYAALDELHQAFQPTRTGAVLDVMLDGAGAAAGIALSGGWRRFGAGQR
jgi:VanZ family protein